MGLKKLFKPPKNIDDKDAKEILEKNGVVVRDNANYHRKKFKFGEFGKFSEQQAQNLDTTLRPVLPNSQTGQGTYNATLNQADSNQGYGYDEYANDFRGQGRSGQTGSCSYSGGYSSPDYGSGNGYSSSSRYGNSGSGNVNSYSYGYDESTSYGARDTRRPSQRSRAKQDTAGAPTQRRPKQSNYPSYSSSAVPSYSYQPSLNGNGSSASLKNDTENNNPSSSNGYGYEPSINNYSSSNGYGFDPYADTAVTAKSVNATSTTGDIAAASAPPLTKTKTSNTTVTQSTYDPYAPGEEPYADDAGAGTAASAAASASASASGLNDSSGYDAGYGAYGAYEPDVNDYGANNDGGDNATITGDQVDSLSSGVQALQLQKEQTQQVQDQDFDPYGPSAELQTQATTAADLDLNAYEPTPEAQEQSVPYDEDEFEEDVDEDEEELNRIQRQTKDVREDTVNLTRTLVDNLGQANVTATNTLGVLGNQREKIYEMQNNIGTMKVQQRFVDDHVKDLEHYNRSLFHIKVSNPFTRNSRRRAKDQAFLAQRQADRANKDKLNSELYQSQRAIMDQLKNDNVKSDLQEKYDYDRRVKEAAKYLTKDHDEEDERMEVEIAANVEHAQKLANNLKKKAMLMNNEIQQQNNDLHDVSGNVDYMDDKVVMTTRRIRGI